MQKIDIENLLYMQRGKRSKIQKNIIVIISDAFW